MGLLDFFIRGKRRSAKRRKAKRPNILGQQIASIQCQIDTINGVLEKHQNGIDENSALLKEHGQKLKSLEDVLTGQSTSLVIRQTNPTQRPNWPAKPVQSNTSNSSQFDINNFSYQEKRILSIFFEHPEMALSYKDLASMLNKAGNTVKNQLNILRNKADLFEKVIDNDTRNRFRLKDGIRIDKYLNMGQSTD